MSARSMLHARRDNYIPPIAESSTEVASVGVLHTCPFLLRNFT